MQPHTSGHDTSFFGNTPVTYTKRNSWMEHLLSTVHQEPPTCWSTHGSVATPRSTTPGHQVL